MVVTKSGTNNEEKIPLTDRAERSISPMRTLRKFSLILLVASFLSATHAAEPDRILNLKGINPLTLSVVSNQLFITVTGRPPHILTFTNLAAIPLRRGEPPDPSKMVQITYGKDLVGRANVLVRSPGAKSSVTFIDLRFETGEQATAAAQALRPRNTTPEPLRKKND